MPPKRKFAVIVDDRNGHYHDIRPAARWWVLAVGRTTEKRVYKNAEKPERRFDSDPYWAIENVGAWFDTVHEAQAFIDDAIKGTAALSAEIERLETVENDARQQRADANTARALRLKTYVEGAS